MALWEWNRVESSLRVKVRNFISIYYTSEITGSVKQGSFGILCFDGVKNQETLEWTAKCVCVCVCVCVSGGCSFKLAMDCDVRGLGLKFDQKVGELHGRVGKFVERFENWQAGEKVNNILLVSFQRNGGTSCPNTIWVYNIDLGITRQCRWLDFFWGASKHFLTLPPSGDK